MEYVINFLIGLLGSLFSAWIFIQFLVIRYRPIIKISPYIAFENNLYWFKFINLSKHDTFDVQLVLEHSSIISGEFIFGESVEIKKPTQS